MKITFNFNGGFLDGETIVGDTNEKTPSPARRYVFLSQGGRVGIRFRDMPPERCEELRRLFMPEEVRDRWMAALEAAMEAVKADIDEENLPPEKELRERYAAAFQEHGVHSALQFLHHASLAEIDQKMRSITSQVFEVTARDERSDEIFVEVTFVGEDHGESLW